MSLLCSNCSGQLATEDKYCSHCGQSTSDHNQPLFSLLKQLAQETFDLDGRTWLTLKTLLISPGQAALEYSQGKRFKYTPPLRLYLAISVLFFLLFSNFQELFAGGSTFTEEMIDTYSKAMFVLFPIFALLLKIFFRHTYYISSLVLSMHIHSVSYLILAIIGPIEKLESDYLVIMLILQLPLVIYFFWYLLQSVKTMYQAKWLITIVKTATIYLVYMGILGVVFDIVLTER